ncbi:cytosolic sulfotransferase [Trifolium repens]|nr:cytosolic sulfotransferase [Trifolium repens]
MASKDLTHFKGDQLKDVELEAISEECKQLILSLPKEYGTAYQYFYFFQGFWTAPSQIQSIISFQNHFQAKDSDIVVASMPKSGTTWLKALTFAIINRHNFSSLENHPLLTSNPHELVPFFELNVYVDTFSQFPKFDILNMIEPRLFGTHIPFPSLAKSIKESNCKIIYICRNPFDTFVSNWNFMNKISINQSLPTSTLEEDFESFEKMKELEANKFGVIGWKIEKKDCFRKAEVGDWINYLSPTMIEKLSKIIEEKISGSNLSFKKKTLQSQIQTNKQSSSVSFSPVMIEKIDSKLELDKTEEGNLGKDNNVTTVESVSIPEPNKQKLVLKVETEEDVEVNIIGNSGLKAVEDNCVDVIEIETSSSSSFDGTGSDTELSDSDDEVETPKREEWRKYMRKRKVTDHWRKFIRPIMVRCKWVELKMRKLNAKARKYEKEIAAIDQQKQLHFLKFAVDDFDVKSVPRSEGIQRYKVMRRKKRKRAEECDPSSYMSNHRLFSYYENNNRDNVDPVEDLPSEVVSDVDFAYNVREFKVNGMRSSVDHHNDADKSVIDTIENIEDLLSKVEKLKSQIDTVMNENPGSFVKVEVEDPLPTNNALPTHEAKAPLIENNQTAKKELHDFKNVIVKFEDKSVEEQKSIAPAHVSDSDIDTKNVVPNIGSSIKACSSSKTHFPRNTRRVKRKFGP